MNPIKSLKKIAGVIACCFLLCQSLFAHNGEVCYAYPLGNIKVDGDFSDWPQNMIKYRIGMSLSDTKPKDDADFSGFFQVGYQLSNHSMYIAFTITDNDFIEDTTANVKFDTQDGLELSIDARHLPVGSGVASYMFSKKLRYTNNAFFDPFAAKASWNIVDIGFARHGHTRYYEWRINLGDQLTIGKSVGFDFLFFDKDSDGSFSFTGWGKGERKFANPNSLGDLIFLPANEKLATLNGHVGYDKKTVHPYPSVVYLFNEEHKQRWLAASLDSLGNYSTTLPPGKYEIKLPDAATYTSQDKKLFITHQQKPVNVLVKAGEQIKATPLILSISLAPDLLPGKGILFDFKPTNTAQLDNFIETYQKYYGIPGVSLALIKEGKLVYHKAYGVKNTITGEKVDDNTLFEAASVTKPVFAFAVQRLAERGIINLDTPLYQYLPYKDIEYDDRYKLITARHVLTHRTGFPNWRSMNPDGKLNLLFTPGTKYNYSGEGFEYLKMVIEKITGKKVEQVLHEEVLDPVGLYHTFFTRNDSLKRMVANGHFDMTPVHDDLPESPGMAYSMHTEAAIFTRFMIYLLEQKGLSEQTYNTMFQKQSEFNYDPGEEKPKIPDYMGISLEIRETAFGKAFGHGGNNGDFKCHFEVYKDLKMGYAIFTNSNTAGPLIDAIRLFLVEGKEK